MLNFKDDTSSKRAYVFKRSFLKLFMNVLITLFRVFINNMATALSVLTTTVKFSGSLTMVGNKGFRGGAIYIGELGQADLTEVGEISTATEYHQIRIKKLKTSRKIYTLKHWVH